MKLLVLNGVNLNMTGRREKSVYGVQTLDEINAELAAFCSGHGHAADFFQSDCEGALCRRLHEADGKYDGIVLNAGAYSHYSYALRDAIAAIGVPVVEVHMSNVCAREPFRRQSVLAEVCRGVILGLGKNGYKLALESFWL